MCPVSMAGKLLGKGGQTIRALRDHSGARIILHDAEPDKDSRTISITGSEPQVETAVSAIKEALEDHGVMAGWDIPGPGANGGFVQPPPPSLHTEQHFSCPTGSAGQLIGKKGETIRTIRERSGARVLLHDLEAGAETRAISISGSEAQVRCAVRMINQTFLSSMNGHNVGPLSFGPNGEYLGGGPIAEDYGGAAHVSALHMGATLDEKLSQWVLAKRSRDFHSADRLREELRLLGVDAEAARPAWPSQMTAEQLHKSNCSLPSPAEHVPSTGGPKQESLLSCPSTVAGRVLGKGGSTIKSIRERSGARVILYDQEEGQDTRVIGITGTEAQVQLAATLVTAAIAEGDALQLGYVPTGYVDVDVGAMQARCSPSASSVGCTTGAGPMDVSNGFGLAGSSMAGIAMAGVYPTVPAQAAQYGLPAVYGDGLATAVAQGTGQAHQMAPSLLACQPAAELQQQPLQQQRQKHLQRRQSQDQEWEQRRRLHPSPVEAAATGVPTPPARRTLSSAAPTANPGTPASAEAVHEAEEEVNASVWCPFRTANRLAGQNGQTMKVIRDTSGAKVVVHEAEPGSDNRLIAIMGTSAQVNAARELLNKMMLLVDGNTE